MSVEYRVAVFSDVHGNTCALEAVLGDISQSGPFDRVIAAGDHCLKGPEPVEAVELVRERVTDVLIGNTDRDIADSGASITELGRKKRQAIEWAQQQLGPERVEWLGALRFEVEIVAPDGSGLLVVHANPRDLDQRLFPELESDIVSDIIGELRHDVLVFGHLHIPYARSINGTRLFDIASCGLPQDGDRRAVWAEFDWSPEEGWRGELRRVPYDYGATVLKILDSGMPNPERRVRDLVSASYV